MINNKKISNILERSISIILDGKVYHNTGVDIIINSSVFIEVKSSYRFSKYSCKTRNQNYRYSHYSFKANELNGYSDYYIFIEKINTKDNLNYIKKLKIYVISTDLIKQYFIRIGKDLTKRIQMSVQIIKDFKYFNLNQLKEKINLD